MVCPRLAAEVVRYFDRGNGEGESAEYRSPNRPSMSVRL